MNHIETSSNVIGMKLGICMKRDDPRRKPSEQKEQLAVYGIYPDCCAAGAAREALRKAAFVEGDVSFLLRTDRPSPAVENRNRSGRPQPPAGAARLGDPPPVNLPEIGHVLASGPIKTTLTSSCDEGQSCMRLSEVLAVFGFPSYHVPLYEHAVLENHVLAVVACGDFESAERAVDLLEGTGASEIGALRRR